MKKKHSGGRPNTLGRRPVQFAFRMSRQDFKAIDDLARREGMTPSGMFREIIREYVDHRMARQREQERASQWTQTDWVGDGA